MKKIRRRIGKGMDIGREDSPEAASCWILTESHEFILRTFAFLPAKTLGICAQVCKAWCREVKRVLHQRDQIGWAASGRLEAGEADKGTKDRSKDQLGRFGVRLNACLSMLSSLPHQAIVFSECLSLEDFQKDDDFDDDEFRPGGTRRLLQESVTAVSSRLPLGSSVVFVHSDGTMGCKADLSPAGETEGAWGTSCILLPNMEGVTVDCRRHYHSDLVGSRVDSYIRSLSLPADTCCILVFSNGGTHGTLVEPLQRGFYSELGTMPVIAGGIAKEMIMEVSGQPVDRRTGSKKLPSCMTVAFSGARVKAASLVLNHSITTWEKARQKLQELKKVGLSEKRSLAFVFSCVGRGRHFYKAEDVESGAFHEVFPDTPLVGFFGGGEYGCDNLTLGENVRDKADADCTTPGWKTAQKKLPSLEQSFTCVICLLSFG
ncbi:F-box only protein 22-like [Acanthaster planci]|uniref:F-box only protein 22-like n=1 Tax=Acanthaster planci TaxID=133434 RepID=A0A8B8A2Z1_ACAPL|nr:F-box only protein 22-like [Acanthaster planci]